MKIRPYIKQKRADFDSPECCVETRDTCNIDGYNVEKPLVNDASLNHFRNFGQGRFQLNEISFFNSF
jgi:hypothetical protein